MRSRRRWPWCRSLRGPAPAAYHGLGTALAGMLVTDLSAAQSLQLVERQRLNAILDELKLAKSGFLDMQSAQRLGRGLGARYVVIGSFSVIKETFLLDVRMVAVETGAVIKAAKSSGPVTDFVAVEKDVVEKLLAGLQVKLSLSARRKLLIQAPTEKAKALASFGRALQAQDKGQLVDAQKAFEQALREDPDFARAARELQKLATLIEKEQTGERTRAKSAREQALVTALATLVPEISRPAKFRDTWQTLLDFALRQRLLQSAKRHCERYAELKHYFFRKKGSFRPWFAGMKGNHRESWRHGEQLMDERGRRLGIFGPRTLFGTRPGQLMFSASPVLFSGKTLLLYGSLTPEAFSDTLLAVMAKCHPPSVQLSELKALAGAVRKWGWGNESLSQTYGEGPSTVTVADSLDLYWAHLRASHWGVDQRVRARTEAVLARHPEGDKDRRSVLSRIKEVISAGHLYEQRIAKRVGLSEAELVVLAKAVTDRDKAALHLDNPLCQSLTDEGRDSAERAQKQYQAEQASGQDRRHDSIVDDLGLAVGPLVVSRCYRRRAQRPLTAQQLVALVKKALKRPHPAKLTDAECAKNMRRLDTQLRQPRASAVAPDEVHAYLVQLQRLHAQRCLAH